MTIGELLARKDLTEKGILKTLICYYQQISKEALRINIDNEISEETIQKILSAYKSYVVDKQPLEYILGFVEFFGTKFFVDRATLIPRPETEYMITAVTEFVKSNEGLMTSNEQKKNTLLDIGTGCGVLGISVLLQNPTYFSQAIFTDYFANALEVAKKNFENLLKNTLTTTKVEFLQADLLDFLVNESSVSSFELNPPVLRTTPPLEKEDKMENTKNDFLGDIILVANLPYIPEKTFDENVADNVKNREPKPAFVGGEDGLDYYRKMFEQLFELIENGKLPLQDKKRENGFVMFLEMMTWQVDILRQEFGDRLVFEEVKTFHFNIRIVKAYLK